MNEHPKVIQKLANTETLAQAEAIYLSIWNMDCPDCAIWLRNGLIQLNSVLKVDVFYKQGVAVIIFVSSVTTMEELLRLIQRIGKETCHYYWAEIIGHSSAKQALRLE